MTSNQILVEIFPNGGKQGNSIFRMGSGKRSEIKPMCVSPGPAKYSLQDSVNSLILMLKVDKAGPSYAFRMRTTLNGTDNKKKLYPGPG
jgi:hypothetical protein